MARVYFRFIRIQEITDQQVNGQPHTVCSAALVEKVRRAGEPAVVGIYVMRLILQRTPTGMGLEALVVEAEVVVSDYIYMDK